MPAGRPALGASKKSVVISGRATQADAELVRRAFGSDANAIAEVVRIARLRSTASVRKEPQR